MYAWFRVQPYILFFKIKKFLKIKLLEGKVNAIFGLADQIKGFGRAILLLASGTNLIIQNTLYLAKSKGKLLSFKDIRQNGYYIETLNQNNAEYLYITKNVSGKKYILEKLKNSYQDCITQSQM